MPSLETVALLIHMVHHHHHTWKTVVVVVVVVNRHKRDPWARKADIHGVVERPIFLHFLLDHYHHSYQRAMSTVEAVADRVVETKRVNTVVVVVVVVVKLNQRALNTVVAVLPILVVVAMTVVSRGIRYYYRKRMAEVVVSQVVVERMNQMACRRNHSYHH